MAYTKTTWVNGQAPAINAANLNKIEQGIYDNDAALAQKASDFPYTITLTVEGIRLSFRLFPRIKARIATRAFCVLRSLRAQLRFLVIARLLPPFR